jgi:hypothetical protein
MQLQVDSSGNEFFFLALLHAELGNKWPQNGTYLKTGSHINLKPSSWKVSKS